MADKISVTKALAELKMISKKITDSITRFEPVVVKIGKNAPARYKSEEDFTTVAKANLQSINDLIDRQMKLKSAIVKSNAITKVTIGEKEMTVAEAIEKKSSIAFRQSLHNHLVNSFNRINLTIEDGNVKVNTRLQSLLEQNFGKDSSKASSADHDAISKPFLDSNELKMIDPLEIRDLIEKLRTEIDEFVLNVDVALSESNSRTDIVVEK